jgi:hypothetical protein
MIDFQLKRLTNIRQLLELQPKPLPQQKPDVSLKDLDKLK